MQAGRQRNVLQYRALLDGASAQALLLAGTVAQIPAARRKFVENTIRFGDMFSNSLVLLARPAG
jgi:hypothetical protein